MNQPSVSLRSGTRGVASIAFPTIGWIKRSLNPIGNATTIPLAIGFVAGTEAGTATARNWASTNVATQTRRTGYVSSASAGNIAGLRGAVANFYRGSAKGLGGFVTRQQFVISDAAAVSGALMFVGLNPAGAIATTTAPTAIANAIGVAQIAGSSNLTMVCNPASGAGRTVDLGSDFLVTATDTVYTLELVCDPFTSGHTIKWSVVNEGTGACATGEFNNDYSELPAATTALAYAYYRDNNATAAAVGIDVCTSEFWTYGV